VHPPPQLLQRIKEGHVGGVILFGDNTLDGVAVTHGAIEALQAAAHHGGDYPLLIMTDQEGGEVRRLTSLPPARPPRAMTSATAAHAEGLATGQALRRVGVDVDLAPVADVEHLAGSFLGTRSFSASAQTVAQRACAFAAGLSQAGVAYTLKHFPGLGRAMASTDGGPVVVDSSSSSLRADYGAYRRCGQGALALVMISSAGYPSLTANTAPAVLSPEIYRDELSGANVHAVTISDDLDTPAIATQRTPALRAIDAGLDLLLYAQTEASSSDAYAKLLADLQAGALSRSRVVQAAASVLALKRSLTFP
jgi:beta-N-acetylhexosaminidase